LSQSEPPKIEFPCDYPIKVLGLSTDDFESIIIDVFHQHAPGFDANTVLVKMSSKGTFSSLNVTITATGPDQLDALHKDLLATGLVKMVI